MHCYFYCCRHYSATIGRRITKRFRRGVSSQFVRNFQNFHDFWFCFYERIRCEFSDLIHDLGFFPKNQMKSKLVKQKVIHFFGTAINSQPWFVCLKANLHWEVARSSRARFFVCFIAGVAVSSPELPDATKQTKEYAWQLLARPQCRLAINLSPHLFFLKKPVLSIFYFTLKKHSPGTS